MRIPNELDADNLYRRRRARPDTVGSTRRIVRLCIVLFLVLVVMRQASRTEIFEIFFAEPMTPVFDDPLISDSPVSTSSTPVTTDPSNVSPAILDAASSDDRQRWLAGLMDPSALSDDDAATMGVDTGAITPAGRAVLARPLLRSLLRDAIDGTVWRAADLPGLTAGLAIHARTPELVPGNPPATGVLPLLQQPEVYRGESFTASGKVVRLESIDASDNAFGVTNYWNVWLRPSDGVDQPWLIAVATLPAAMLPLVPEGERRVDVAAPLPEIQVRGEFLKRLSFPTSAGFGITPVVVGHVTAMKSNGNSAMIAAGPGERTAPAGGDRARTTSPSLMARLAAALVATTFVGVALGSWLMWRSKMEVNRARARRNQRPVELPVQELPAHDSQP